MLAINQYGERMYLPGKHPRKELLAALGASSCERMYRDKPDGLPVHVGYIVAGVPWTLYNPVERRP